MSSSTLRFTATTASRRAPKAGISVLGLRLGAGGEVTYEKANVSRVQFRVPVSWPGQRNEELEAKRAEERQEGGGSG